MKKDSCPNYQVKNGLQKMSQKRRSRRQLGIDELCKHGSRRAHSSQPPEHLVDVFGKLVAKALFFKKIK